jgi:hypothetical protein
MINKKRKTRKIKKIRKNKKQKAGNENIELVVKSFGAGFFANFNNLIQFLVDMPNITKITYDVKSLSSGSMAYIKEDEELYSKIFEPYDEGKSITKTITSIREDYNDIYLGGRNSYNYYGDKRIKLQPAHNAFIKYIKVKENIQEKINEKLLQLKENSEQIIGIFVRSNALAVEQPNGKMPTREDYDKVLRKIDLTKKTKYFLRIDNEEDLNYYKNKYKPNYYTDISRSINNKGNALHLNNLQSLEDLEKTYIEVALLSNCHILLHCSSNMATAALYMNMNLKSIFIQNGE